MSDIQEIIELTERVSKNSDMLVSRVIELSYGLKSGAGIDYSLFAFGIFALASLIGYLLANIKICRQNSAEDEAYQKNLVSEITLGLAAIGLFAIISSTKIFSLIILLSIIVFAAITALIFANFFNFFDGDSKFKNSSQSTDIKG